MRIWKRERIFFVTNRCEQERLFMLPRKGLNQLIGAWLAKSLEEHGQGIELYAFVFMGNRVAPEVAPRGSHRSGRADLPHPAPQHVDLLRE